MQYQKKNTPILSKVLTFQMHQFGSKKLSNDCIIGQINKLYPYQKQLAEKQDFKGQSIYSNNRVSFDTKGLLSTSSEINS